MRILQNHSKVLWSSHLCNRSVVSCFAVQQIIGIAALIGCYGAVLLV